MILMAHKTAFYRMAFSFSIGIPRRLGELYRGSSRSLPQCLQSRITKPESPLKLSWPRFCRSFESRSRHVDSNRSLSVFLAGGQHFRSRNRQFKSMERESVPTRTLLVTDPCYAVDEYAFQELLLSSGSEPPLFVRILVGDLYDRVHDFTERWEETEEEEDEQKNSFCFGQIAQVSMYEYVGSHANDSGMTALVDPSLIAMSQTDFSALNPDVQPRARRSAQSARRWEQFVSLTEAHPDKYRLEEFPQFVWFGKLMGGDVGASVYALRTKADQVCTGLLITSGMEKSES